MIEFGWESESWYLVKHPEILWQNHRNFLQSMFGLASEWGVVMSPEPRMTIDSILKFSLQNSSQISHPTSMWRILESTTYYFPRMSILVLESSEYWTVFPFITPKWVLYKFHPLVLIFYALHSDNTNGISIGLFLEIQLDLKFQVARLSRHSNLRS